MRKLQPSRIVAYAVVLFGMLWATLPLYFMIITSFKTQDEVWQSPPTLWPSAITFDGFIAAWTLGGGKGMQDSAIVAIGTLFISIVLGLPAAYAIARFKTGGDNLSFTVLSFRFMPPIAPVVAFFLVATSLHIFDSYPLLIMVNSMANLPFVIWILKGFIEEIPIAIEEAAAVDGASRFRMLRDQILPLAAPGVVAVSLFCLIFTWNEFLFSNVLTALNVETFAKAVPSMTVGVYNPYWGAIAAMGVFVVVPIAILSFYLQKYIVRGLSYGAIRS